ncbi:MAG: sialidase family protein [Myxococcota bacterium]
MPPRLLALAVLALACQPPKPGDDADPPDPSTSSDPTTPVEQTTPPTTPPTDTVPVDVDIGDVTDLRLCETGGVVYLLASNGSDVYVDRTDDFGASWLPAPGRATHGGGGPVYSPQLACEGDVVVVAWEDERDGSLGNHQIYANRSDDGGATFLGQDLLLEDDPDGLTMSLAPAVALAGGVAHVAWADNDAGAYDILVASSGAGGASWSAPVRLDSDGPGQAYSARPQIATSRDGTHVWVAWEDARDGASDIRFTASHDQGRTFRTDRRMDDDAPGAADSFEPRLCTDGGERVSVVWHDRRNGEADVYASLSDSAGDDFLSTDLRLDSDPPGEGTSLFPDCAMDGATVHVVWEDRRVPDGAFDAYHRTLTGGLYGDETRLNAGVALGAANAQQAAVAVDGGTVLAAWADARAADEGTGWADVYGAFADRGAGFGGEVLLSDAYAEGASYKAELQVVAASGWWLAAWIDGRGGGNEVLVRQGLLP